MPVDPDGKVIPDNPADRYATPINRKPKKHFTLKDYLFSFGILGGLALLISFFGRPSSHTTQASPAPIWITANIWQGAGSTEVGPADVTGTWRFTWQCPVINNAMTMHVVDGSGNTLVLKNVECTRIDHVGFTTLTYTGQASIEISAVGSWTVSIREPTQ